jgi:hypothetical protein
VSVGRYSQTKSPGSRAICHTRGRSGPNGGRATGYSACNNWLNAASSIVQGGDALQHKRTDWPQQSKAGIPR